MKEILDNEFKNAVLDNKKVVLLDVYASWCGPCKMLAPILESLQKECEDWLDVIKANVDEANEIANNLSVSSIPALFIFKNGEEVDRSVGFKTLNQLKDWVESYK